MAADPVLVAVMVVLALCAFVALRERGRETAGPERIVFSSGGMKGAAHAGVLLLMHERGLLSRATEFAGSSVGAVMAAACAMRMDVGEMVRLWSDLDYVALMTGANSTKPRRLGKFGGREMHEFFRGFVGRETGNRDITFRELHRARGTTLVVAVTCVSLRRCVYFTHTDSDYADTPVALALRMSCSLPFVLEPVSYLGLLFADGAITENLPLSAFRDDGRATLGVWLMSKGERPGGVYTRDERGEEGEQDARAYSAMLLDAAMRTRRRCDARARILYVSTDSGFGVTRVENEDTAALMRRGYVEARRFFLGIAT